MKAVAVFPETREVKLIEHPEPSLRTRSDVKLRMLEVGICGTDREIVSFEYGSPPAGSEYLVVGHESLGEVVETGSAVTRVKPGDLAVPMVRRPCAHPECLACTVDRQDFCYTGDFTECGIKGRHGFMAEFVVDDEEYMNPVPRELRQIAVLTEPLTIAEKALTQLWQVQQRLPWACSVVPGQKPGACHRALVLGAGPVGLLGAMTLSAAGFETTVYSRGIGSRAAATIIAAIGAKGVASETTSPDDLRGQIGNIDVVYEATGAATVSFDVMRVLGTNGVFIFTGVPGRKGAIELDAELIMRDLVLQNQIVFGTVNAGREAYEAAVRDLLLFAQRWPDAVRGLITSRVPITGAPALLLAPSQGIKNVVKVA